MFRIIFIISIIFFVKSFSIYAQTRISDIDTKKIHHKKVIKYLKNKELKKTTYFSEITPSISDTTDLSVFYFHRGTYTIKTDINSVWHTCMTVSPSDLWKGKMVSLSCIYNSNSDKISYNENRLFDTLAVNQIYFLNLRVLSGLLNVVASLKVTKIDAKEKIIVFKYIKGNKSIGKQTLFLTDLGNNETLITHDTYFKSNSKFRDKRFYKHFHEIAITDLHKNIDKYSIQLKEDI